MVLSPSTLALTLVLLLAACGSTRPGPARFPPPPERTFQGTPSPLTSAPTGAGDIRHSALTAALQRRVATLPGAEVGLWYEDLVTGATLQDRITLGNRVALIVSGSPYTLSANDDSDGAL